MIRALTLQVFINVNKATDSTLLPPANVVCEGYIFTGICDSVIRGGMRGFIRGGCVVLFGGVRFYSGGCAWFYLGGVHGFIWGHAWFYPGGACMVLFGGGACVVLSGGHAWFF